MKQYYECHVTFLANGNGGLLQAQKVVQVMGWTFSKIDGDILYGGGIKCYATHHFNKRVKLPVVQLCVEEVGDVLADGGFKVLREKIELVIYDKRYKNGKT